MNKFARILGIFVLILGISLAFGTKLVTADKADVATIMNYIENNKKVLYESNLDNDIMKIYENTGKHNHFPTTWKDHYYFVMKRNIYGVELAVPYFHIVVRDYQNFYTSHDAMGFVMVSMADFNNDGEVDWWMKDFVIVLDGYTILRPHYPEGYVNYDWFELTREEAQAIFDAEIKFAVEKIEGEK